MSDDPAQELAPAVAETHTSTLVFVGDRAYKLKRPVDLGFLDFRTREAREAACHREVDLNRRLAPDVYLGVADVSGPDGDPWDHLVVMQRMPVERRLSTLVDAGEEEVVHDALDDVAHQLATLHGVSPPTGDRAAVASPEALGERWEEALSTLRDLDDEVVSPDVVDGLGASATRYLEGRGPLFTQRTGKGRIVAGHGDLRAEDVFVLDGGCRILDCLDFDDDLMWGDGLLDAAFLAMDLHDAARPDLAEAFLDRYAELAADRWPASLAHHLIAYRASVRAKVAAVRVQQGHDEAGDEVRRYVELCTAALARGRVRLVLVGGTPGTGKSTLARALADRTGMVVLSSDEVRDDVDPADGDGAPSGVGEGRYAPEHKARVYEELRRRAEELLGHGESVVLDASWSDADERDAPGRSRRARRRRWSSGAAPRPPRRPTPGSGRGRPRATTPPTPTRRWRPRWENALPTGPRPPRSTPSRSPGSSPIASSRPSTSGADRRPDGRGRPPGWHGHPASTIRAAEKSARHPEPGQRRSSRSAPSPTSTRSRTHLVATWGKLSGPGVVSWVKT